MMFQSLDFYNPAADVFWCCWQSDFPFMQDACLCMGMGSALGAPDIHKAIWQVIIPPSCPVGRKTNALLLNLSMPTHIGMIPAGFQVSRTVSLCRSQLILTWHRSPPPPSATETGCCPSAFLSFLMLCHTRAAGKGHILLDPTQYCNKNLFPSIYNPHLKPL